MTYKDIPSIVLYDDFLLGVVNKVFEDKDGYGIFLTKNLEEIEPSVAEVKCDFKYLLNYYGKYPFVLWRNY